MRTRLNDRVLCMKNHRTPFTEGAIYIVYSYVACKLTIGMIIFCVLAVSRDMRIFQSDSIKACATTPLHVLCACYRCFFRTCVLCLIVLACVSFGHWPAQWSSYQHCRSLAVETSYAKRAYNENVASRWLCFDLYFRGNCYPSQRDCPLCV